MSRIFSYLMSRSRQVFCTLCGRQCLCKHLMLRLNQTEERKDSFVTIVLVLRTISNINTIIRTMSNSNTISWVMVTIVILVVFIIIIIISIRCQLWRLLYLVLIGPHHKFIEGLFWFSLRTWRDQHLQDLSSLLLLSIISNHQWSKISDWSSMIN